MKPGCAVLKSLRKSRSRGGLEIMTAPGSRRHFFNGNGCQPTPFSIHPGHCKVAPRRAYDKPREIARGLFFRVPCCSDRRGWAARSIRSEAIEQAVAAGGAQVGLTAAAFSAARGM